MWPLLRKDIPRRRKQGHFLRLYGLVVSGIRRGGGASVNVIVPRESINENGIG